jgi:hypothetical protein
MTAATSPPTEFPFGYNGLCASLQNPELKNRAKSCIDKKIDMIQYIFKVNGE